MIKECQHEGVTDTVASALKKQLLEAARDPLAAWLDEKVCNNIVMSKKLLNIMIRFI